MKYSVKILPIRLAIGNAVFKLGRALTASELFELVTDEITKQFPNMLMGELHQVRKAVMLQLGYSKDPESGYNFKYTYSGGSDQWKKYADYCMQDIETEAEIRAAFEGTIDFEEQNINLVEAFEYKGHTWKAPPNWYDYKQSKGDFAGGFTRITPLQKINTRVFEAIPFDMIKC